MYYNKDDYSMYYEKHGNGDKTLLILPGWGNTRNTFRMMIDYFKDKYTIYIVDYPGFGKSVFPNRDLTIYDYANIIRDFMTDEDITNPIIITHSFGGRISTLISGYYKDKVDKLIMIDTAGIKHKKGLFKYLKQLLYKFLKKIKFIIPKRKRSLYLKRLINIFGSSDYKNLDKYMYNSFKNIVNEDLSYYLKCIDVKTLIIWGNLDKDTPLKDGKITQKKIRNSSLVILPKGSHFSYLNYPNLVNKLIEEFLKDD